MSTDYMDLHESLVPASSGICIMLAISGCGFRVLFTLSQCLNFILLQNSFLKIIQSFLFCWATECARWPGNKLDFYQNIQLYLI